MPTSPMISSRLSSCVLGLSLMVATATALQAEEMPPAAPSDPSTSGPLYEELARMDRLVFDASFVECDARKVHSFFSDDIEFYHDQTGFHKGQQVREDFERLTGSCPGERGVTRELVDGSLKVYPMSDYGAVQTGIHRFVERGASTSTLARFVHLWQKKDGEWKITRVLSFDHRSVNSASDPD